MRGALVALSVLCVTATVAAAAPGEEPSVRVVGRPPFAGPASAPSSSGAVQLELVSSRSIDPASGAPGRAVPAWAPRTFRRGDLVVVATQPGTTFIGYGEHGGLTRYLVARGPAHGVKWMLDITSLDRGSWPLELRWARQVGGVVYLSNAHRTYAATTGDRNGYLTAVDPATGRILWQTPSLVANADEFAVVGDVIVTGYGFTAEPDWLYTVDRRSGKVTGRLALPSAPERIGATGTTLNVRTYDHRLVVRLGHR